MVNISEEKWIEMLEKKADGSYIVKYPKIKSKSGVTFDELLTNKISAGTGLLGGGDLSRNRELKVNFGTSSTQVARGNHGHEEYAPKSNEGFHAGSLKPEDIKNITLRTGFYNYVAIRSTSGSYEFVNGVVISKGNKKYVMGDGHYRDNYDVDKHDIKIADDVKIISWVFNDDTIKITIKNSNTSATRDFELYWWTW